MPEEKLAFKGVFWKIYQWEQEMFDGSVKTFERAVRPSYVGVIAEADGRILYCKQEQPGSAPFLAVFGGGVDEGDEPLQTAKRELLEESGYASDDWTLLSTNRMLAKRMDFTVYIYLARGCKKVAQQNLDAGEKIEILSASIDEFVDLIGRPEWREKTITDMFYGALDPTKVEGFKDLIKNNKG
ncbi:MAG: NUDIX hydrolase [Alphaproteobacteria bacterium]|nr:NUDIX hydrolase [Alphaproteobacteria bacterium]